MENEKLYESILTMDQEMKDGYRRLDDKVDAVDKSLKNEIHKVDEAIIKTNVMIEHEVMPKIGVLFDGYTQINQTTERIDSKIDEMQSDINHLTVKALAQENKIIDLTKRVK